MAYVSEGLMDRDFNVTPEGFKAPREGSRLS